VFEKVVYYDNIVISLNKVASNMLEYSQLVFNKLTVLLISKILIFKSLN